MKVYKAKFESGNSCYVFAENKEWAMHYFDKVMYECYSLTEWEEIGDTIAGIVYVADQPSEDKYIPENGELFVSRHKRLSRWYEIFWHKITNIFNNYDVKIFNNEKNANRG